jgi:hypothetical protein
MPENRLQIENQVLDFGLSPLLTHDFSLWKDQVRQAIDGLYSFAPPVGPGFHAALRRLYTECHFAEFIACQGWRRAGLDERSGAALQALQAQLDAYDEPDTDVAIWADPQWWGILGQAMQVAALLG